MKDKYAQFGKRQRSGKVFQIKGQQKLKRKLHWLSEGGRIINPRTNERKRP